MGVRMFLRYCKSGTFLFAYFSYDEICRAIRNKRVDPIMNLFS